MQTTAGTTISAKDPREVTNGETVDLRAAEGAASTNYGTGRLRLVMSVMAIVLFAVDQWTKHRALETLSGGKSIELIPEAVWFSLHFNPGAAFSLGTQFTVALSVLALVVLLGLVIVVLPRVRSWLTAVMVSWVIAGTAGNLTDRVIRDPGPFRGHVVDFVAVRGFAVFNFADICITGAGILFVISLLRSGRR